MRRMNIQLEQVGFWLVLCYHTCSCSFWISQDSPLEPSVPVRSLNTFLHVQNPHSDLLGLERNKIISLAAPKELRECVLWKANYPQTCFAWIEAQIFPFYKRIQPILLRSSLLVDKKWYFAMNLKWQTIKCLIAHSKRRMKHC